MMTMAQYLEFFPTRPIATFLIEHYFEHSSFHWMWPIIHRPHFNILVTATLETATIPSADFVALFALIVATALQFLPRDDNNVNAFPLALFAWH
jgi:hypothetical protein